MNKKNVIFAVIFAIVIGALSISAWLKPDTAFTESERRPLAQKPDLTVETIFSGEFMKDFENYAVDQFPKRESFRKIKAVFSKYIFNKKENNGLFTADGHISKLEYPENPEMTENAKEKFDYLYENYLKDMNVYLSIVPDKNYFLAEKNGYPSIDYDKFINGFKNKVDYMTYIDILPLLSIDDYYKTDSHWKQEEIINIAEHLANAMGSDCLTEYDINTLDNSFQGVYLGQSALPFEADTLKYLTNESLNEYIVNYLDTGKAIPGEIYNLEKAYGKDPYEIFLSGTSALIEIENPNADTDKELILFRDSFGSSIAPLLASGYKKITVVDIRYVQSSFLGNLIDFNNQDVLFLYSTTLLNNSTAMR